MKPVERKYGKSLLVCAGLALLVHAWLPFAGNLYGAGAIRPGYPGYMFNFTTDATSTMPGYSGPGLLPAFSVPGGDILGTFFGSGLVVPPMGCNRPAVICPAGPAGFGMGFPTLPACVEIDAYSTGEDFNGPAWPWTLVFSVDRSSVGFTMPRPFPPCQWSDVAMEAVANDAAADEFVSGVYLKTQLIQGKLHIAIGCPGWNYLSLDGNGIQAGPLPACVPSPSGLGLVEPSPPGGGDDLDGCAHWVAFHFATVGMTSPSYPPPTYGPFGIPVLGQGTELRKGLFFSLDPRSAAAYGVSPADILSTNNGGPPWVWATAQQLGLHPQTDDIDALAMWYYGGGGKPVTQGMRYNIRNAFIVFSVSRTSTIVGSTDALWGIPIMPSDLLMPADLLGYPGQVAILVPSGGLGLYPFLQRPAGVQTDNLNALYAVSTPNCPEDLEEEMEWESFILCEEPSSYIPEDAVEAWDEFPLPEETQIPAGPFDPMSWVETGEPEFIRGDANTDGMLDIADGIFLLSYLFVNGPNPPCDDAADANDDGRIDLGDPIRILGYFFRGEDPIPAPHPHCGIDPTADQLGCEVYTACN